MDTFFGCRIVEYLVIVEYRFIVCWPSVCDLGEIHGCVLFAIININRPDGSTCSQAVYVLKYSPRACVVSAIVGS